MNSYRGVGLMAAGIAALVIGWPTVKTMPVTVILGIICIVWGLWRFIEVRKVKSD
jgi:uncharacterized membrane protein HdeD (DUF308 family)